MLILLFGLECLSPCTLTFEDQRILERTVVRELKRLDLTVKRPFAETRQPTASGVSPQVNGRGNNPASAHGADRALVLEFDPLGPMVRMTWFSAGVVGPWRVSKVPCAYHARRLSCPTLGREVRRYAGPRRGSEVDLLGALRSAGRPVGRCVAAEKRRPLATRLFGRVDLNLEVLPSGRFKVVGMAPARAARGPLGRCLRKAMEGLRVKPFIGPPLSMRIPVDL